MVNNLGYKVNGIKKTGCNLYNFCHSKLILEFGYKKNIMSFKKKEIIANKWAEFSVCMSKYFNYKVATGCKIYI